MAWLCLQVLVFRIILPYTFGSLSFMAAKTSDSFIKVGLRPREERTEITVQGFFLNGQDKFSLRPGKETLLFPVLPFSKNDEANSHFSFLNYSLFFSFS